MSRLSVLFTCTKVFGQGARVLQKQFGAQHYCKMAKPINFNTKHLKKGDPLPPYNGTLRVYNMRYCPYAQRIILALNAKGINYEVVNINLAEKPEWLTQKSAYGKVPALEVSENVTIYESLVTVEYIDEVYPQNQLLPKDPLQKAYDRIIIEAINPVHTLMFKQIRLPDSITQDNIDAYNKSLDFIQSQLLARGTTFLGGDQPGYADYMIWPWFERILLLQKTNASLVIDAARYKLLYNYFDKMLADPAVSQYLIPDDVWNKFFTAYSNGQTPDYDQLLEK